MNKSRWLYSPALAVNSFRLWQQQQQQQQQQRGMVWYAVDARRLPRVRNALPPPPAAHHRVVAVRPYLVWLPFSAVAEVVVVVLVWCGVVSCGVVWCRVVSCGGLRRGGCD